MAAWNTDDSSSDSGDDGDNPNVVKSANNTHSSYDYWQQYYQKRKQHNIKQTMNSNQRSYHKYQRNFISSKTGNVSNYHSQPTTNYKSKPSPKYGHVTTNNFINNFQNTPPLLSNPNININNNTNKHKTSPNTNNTPRNSLPYKSPKSLSSSTNRNKFNTHIVSTRTSIDPSIACTTPQCTQHKTAADTDEDILSPFLRVQRVATKMPYTYNSYSSNNAPLLMAMGGTPSSSTHNHTAFNSFQMKQLQQPIHISYNNRNSCMKSTQAASLSSLMFTTPQKYTYFQQHRHLYFHHEEFTKQRRQFVKQWRAKEKDKRAMRTEGIILSLCLNIGVDPPDIVRTNPCAVSECWMNPNELPASRALEVIAKRLEQQYSAWKGKSRKLNVKKILDGNPELVRQTCGHLRQYATDRRVIFHYNGHGVPRPTEHGELWFFNSNFSEYLPVSILDIAQWLQTPSMIILDCSSAGKIVSSFKQYEPVLKQQRLLGNGSGAVVDNKKKHRGTMDESEYADTDSLYRFGVMILAACDENEILPMNPSYPADIFTSCLTSPIRMALKWFISTQLLHDKNNKHPHVWQGQDKNDKKVLSEDERMEQKEHLHGTDFNALLEMIFDESIGGKKEDKKNILGELHWVFLSVTDTIAWNVLPNKLFQNLFRLDYTIQSLFRNYLLAERIMKSMNRTPISYPPLPCTNNHPMWQSWDSAVDAALLQLKSYVHAKNQWHYQQLFKLKIQKQNEQIPAREEKKASDGAERTKQKRFTRTSSSSNLLDREPELKWKASNFFEQQLRAFEVWIEAGEIQQKPYHLPIVLQALLNKQYRLTALTLLSRYLDLGPWTVNYVLWVGLHSYFKLLLKQAINDEKNSSKTLRYSLTFIWAKILAHDPSCRHDLIAGKHYVFFYRELKRKDNSDQQIFLSTFILSQIASYQPTGQKVLLSKVCGGIKKNANSLLNMLKTNIFHPNNNIKIWSILCIAKIWENLDEIKCIAYDITDVLLLQLSSICIEVRAVTMYALGTFFNLRDIQPNSHEFLGPNMDLNLAHQLTKLVHDPSPIIRMELVFVLSSLIYYQQDQFREYYNKQKLIKKEQRRRAKEEQQQMQDLQRVQIFKSQSNYNITLNPKHKSGGFFSKSLNKKHTHSESMMNISTTDIKLAHSHSHQPQHQPRPQHHHQYNYSNQLPSTLLPTLQTTQSVPGPPQQYNLPQLHTGKVAQSAFNPTFARSHNESQTEQLSPMIAPLNPHDIPTAPTDNNSNSNSDIQINIDEEYEQRKRIWEVIKVLCKDPIAEISRNANKVKSYMTSDRVKASRSRALSDPEKHAKLIKEKTALFKSANQSSDGFIQRAASDCVVENKQNDIINNVKQKKPNHNKSNTIFGALSGGIGSKHKRQNKAKTHRKIASHTYAYTPREKKNMRGKSAFFVSHDSESLKSDDPNWSIPDSPLFSWLTQYISRPLTNAMYDAPDPLYHELDAKNLPLIDPRLTMSNFFYHQEQHKYDQEQRLVAKRYEENSVMNQNNNTNNNEESDYLYGVGSRGSISEYFRSGGASSNSYKLRYNEMNETLALNYIRLAAIRSWETRKFYMFAERAKSIWKQLLHFADPNTYALGDGAGKKKSKHMHSKSVASSPNPSMNEQSYDDRLASTSFTLPSGMIVDDKKPRARSMSNDYQQRQIANGKLHNNNNPKSPTKKKKILSFLGGVGGSNKSKINENEASGKLGSSYDGNSYKYVSHLSPKKSYKKYTEPLVLSHSLDTPLNNNKPMEDGTESDYKHSPVAFSKLFNKITSNAHINSLELDDELLQSHSLTQIQTPQQQQPSPYISPYNLSEDMCDSDNNYICRPVNGDGGFGSNLSKESASKFIKTGMRINNQIERYDTECDGGITAIKFHPFRNILYCGDAAGRVWVWKYEGNIGANNPNNKRRINLVNIKDTHLSNACVTGSMHQSNNSNSVNNISGYGLGHSQSMGNFGDAVNSYNHNDETSNSNTNTSTNSGGSGGVVVTSFEIINKYHDTMLLCAGSDGTIRIYRNSHLENSMSAVTAFLANARIKPTRQTGGGMGGGGRMITSFCEEFGYLYSGGSHNSVKIHDCHNEAYFGNYYTKCNTRCILRDDVHKNLLIAGCVDNRIRLFDLRCDLNKNTNTKEMGILFSSGKSAKILSIKPTHKHNTNCYYICSTQELLLFDLRNQSIISKIPFKKYINTFDSHKYAPIYALGSTKQFVQICSSLKLDSNIVSSSFMNEHSNKKIKQQMQSVNEICYHDGFLGARIGPVRLLKFHPYKLLLAVGGTNKHLSLYSSSNSKNNSLL